jgi:hypothetical protein
LGLAVLAVLIYNPRVVGYKGEQLVTQFRRNLMLTGLGGLLACVLLAALSTWLVSSGVITPPLPYRAVTILSVVIFGAFSLAEIPMMVFAMGRLAAEQRGNRRIVFGMNGFYVFFAAVYAIPVLLLTGSVGWGLALCGLGIARFFASLTFVAEPPS